jgi:hypothetical protein
VPMRPCARMTAISCGFSPTISSYGRARVGTRPRRYQINPPRINRLRAAKIGHKGLDTVNDSVIVVT